MYGSYPLIVILAYPLLAFGALTVLCRMILKVGTLIGDCPATRGRARAAAMTIATGFAAIGAGGVVLAGAVVVLAEAALPVALTMLGFVVLCLGLGFGHAIATLRSVVAPEPSADEAEVTGAPV